jgi:hypothetical protein
MNTATQDPSSTVHLDAVGGASNVDPHSAPGSTDSGPSLPRPVSTRSGPSRDNRCQYRYSNGKRCRLTGSKSHFGHCPHHFNLSNPGASHQQSPSDSEDLSPELLPQLSEFESAADVKEFLARLLVLVTKGRVTPRRASVLAYITNQLLHSHSAFYRELHAQDDEPQQWIMDLPRPRRDDPVSPSHPDMSWLAPGADIPDSKESSCLP